MIFITKYLVSLFRINFRELLKATTILIYNTLREITTNSYAVCDVWCSWLIVCLNDFDSLSQGETKIPCLGFFRIFEGYSKVDPRWHCTISCKASFKVELLRRIGPILIKLYISKLPFARPHTLCRPGQGYITATPCQVYITWFQYRGNKQFKLKKFSFFFK